ncbi:MAG TPA: hypothetical protein VJY54_06605 [Lachnospiraceae bacterium]|nr:hypothetical protein [Lachnospiraceae bacterium]
MKIVKGISLFLIYPCIMLGIGFFLGVYLNRYFYPGNNESTPLVEQLSVESKVQESGFLQSGESNTTDHDDEMQDDNKPVSVGQEAVLSADTDYVIEEYDVKRESLIETTWKVPEKYLGMDRDEFVGVMNLYALSPPLSEQERGFIGLEVRSFSAEKVVVRMSYAYAEPTEGFYLRVENNSIVVYCDDGETVYMYTDISAQSLPEYIQGQIIMGMYMEDEATLYHFLETYSS